MTRRRLFVLLLLYSLLPGAAKLAGMPALFAGNLLLIPALLAGTRQGAWGPWDRPLLLILGWLLVYTPIAFVFVPMVDGELLAAGAYLSVVPMSGYVLSRRYGFVDFAVALCAVGLIHVAYGFLTYGFLPLPEWAETIREGTMAFRMASVSGSLAFSVLALFTFVVLLALASVRPPGSRAVIGMLAAIALAAVALSLQRGAWVGACVALAAYTMSARGRLRAVAIGVVAAGAVVVLVSHDAIESILGHGGMANRVNSLFDTRSSEGAVGERSAMWRASLGHVVAVPTGVGLGQVGQATRVFDRTSGYAPVLDGDYFKIAAELGVPGIVYLLSVFWMLGVGFARGSSGWWASAARVGLLAVLGQMVGTNISELYFVNFILWAFVGYVALDVGGQKATKRVGASRPGRVQVNSVPVRAERR